MRNIVVEGVLFPLVGKRIFNHHEHPSKAVATQRAASLSFHFALFLVGRVHPSSMVDTR